ncbi:MAG: 30S ribosomal protein S20 [Planctomycetota bacterium]|jgi:small subunit ribosomal protein S20
MPHNASAKKRLRQDEVKRIRNKSDRSVIKTWTRKLESAVESKDKALAEKYFRETTSALDKAVKKGVYHKNTIARKKSHASKLINSLG